MLGSATTFSTDTENPGARVDDLVQLWCKNKHSTSRQLPHKHGAMEPAQLHDPPFTDNAPKGPDEFFPPTQMAQLVEIIRSINASADVHTA
jgi:hypothetical protein